MENGMNQDKTPFIAPNGDYKLLPNIKTPKMELTELKKKIVAEQFKNFTEKTFFDITKIKLMKKLCGYPEFSPESLEFYQALHCVDWADLGSELSIHVIAMVKKDLNL